MKIDKEEEIIEMVLQIPIENWIQPSCISTVHDSTNHHIVIGCELYIGAYIFRLRLGGGVSISSRTELWLKYELTDIRILDLCNRVAERLDKYQESQGRYIFETLGTYKQNGFKN